MLTLRIFTLLGIIFNCLIFIQASNIIQSNDDCFDYGTDYIGFDLDDGTYVSTESASACQINCQETANCEFWTWDPDYYSACWRKWGKLETQFDYRLTSGPKFCDGTTIKPDSSLMRTMSYNMFGWNALHDHSKTENMYRTIRAFGPDLLGTQEIDEFAYQVAENIGNDYAVAADGYSQGHAILYRTSVFDLVSSGYEILNEQDQWGQRTVEYAQLIHKASGTLVDHFNTHFCVCYEGGTCCGQDKGLSSAHTVEATMEKYRRSGSLLTLTGDLNVFAGFEDHPAIRYFKGELDGDMPPYILEDTFRVANGENTDGTTFPNNGKIDYLFAEQGAGIVSANIDRTSYGPASDHWPINAVIKVQ